jgi:hypothetical protein
VLFQHHPPCVVAFASDHFVAEAIRLTRSGRRSIPRQLAQSRLDATGVGGGELSSINGGV